MKTSGVSFPAFEPRFDEGCALNCRSLECSIADVIGFSEHNITNAKSAKNKIVFEPLVKMLSSDALTIKADPICDIKSSHVRLKDNFLKDKNFIHNFLYSLFLHLILVILIACVSYFGWNNGLLDNNSITPIEVSFGLADIVDKTNESAVNKENSPADILAQKTLQQLPQLPKLVAVDGVEVKPDTLPLPVVPNIKTPTPTAELLVTPDPNITKIKAAELLKRAEKEKREIGLKETAGTHVNPKEGLKKLEELPTDPFAQGNTQATNALPSGSLDGKISSQHSRYRDLVRNHIRREWSLPDVYTYDSKLLCKVRIIVNLYGKQQDVKIINASGNKNFDEEVLDTIKRSNPFPDFSTDGELKRIIELVFRPMDIK